jgi:hypothetical protein
MCIIPQFLLRHWGRMPLYIPELGFYSISWLPGPLSPWRCNPHKRRIYYRRSDYHWRIGNNHGNYTGIDKYNDVCALGRLFVDRVGDSGHVYLGSPGF